MARLPDRFDLWVRKARECQDVARQADYVLGALAGLKEWYFLNLGTEAAAQAAETEIEGARCLLVFSDATRIEELLQEREGLRPGDAMPVMTIPTAAAMVWCLERPAGLLVNPGEDAVMIPFRQLEHFHTEWSGRGGPQAVGFWIPNLTTAEEDFWQEHGL
jgi:hypothetical protein